MGAPPSDLEVEEVGDDMFDVLCKVIRAVPLCCCALTLQRCIVGHLAWNAPVHFHYQNAGAMRFKVGSSLTRAQVVSLVHEAIEKRKERHKVSLPCSVWCW